LKREKNFGWEISSAMSWTLVGRLSGLGDKRLVRNTVGSRQVVALPSNFGIEKNGCRIEEQV
jgi:hypothetical protein